MNGLILTRVIKNIEELRWILIATNEEKIINWNCMIYSYHIVRKRWDKIFNKSTNNNFHMNTLPGIHGRDGRDYVAGSCRSKSGIHFQRSRSCSGCLWNHRSCKHQSYIQVWLPWDSNKTPTRVPWILKILFEFITLILMTNLLVGPCKWDTVDLFYINKIYHWWKRTFSITIYQMFFKRIPLRRIPPLRNIMERGGRDGSLFYILGVRYRQ